MKTVIITTALSLLCCLAQSQDSPPAAAAAETVKKAHATAWLGIGMEVSDGKLVVSQVSPDSPAAKAGLQAGDVLLRFGETAIDGSAERVVNAVTAKQPGDTIEVHWQRGEKEGSSRVELAARPEPSEKDFRGDFRRPEKSDDAESRARKLKDKAEQALKKAADTAKDSLEKTNQRLEELHKIENRPTAFLGIAVEPATDGKIAVTQVLPDSPAAKAGLREGDFLLSIGGEPIKGDAQHFVKTIAGKKPGEVIDLRWQRGDREETSRIELAQRTLDEDTKNAVEEFRRKVERSKDELEHHARRLRLDLDSPEGDKTLRFYLDKDWAGNEADRKEWQLRSGKEVPLFERRFLGGANNLKGFVKVDPREQQENEDAIWKRVQESVAEALKESDLGPDVTERVMQAVENARRAGSEKQARREKLEAEAARVEKEMQTLKDRANKLREELNKSAE